MLSAPSLSIKVEQPHGPDFQGDNCGCSFATPGPNSAPSEDKIFVDKESRESTSRSNRRGRVMGQLTGRPAEFPGLEDKPSAGESYRVFNTKDESLSEPFHVKSVGVGANGLTEIKITGHDNDGPSLSLYLNPDYDVMDSRQGILGQCCKFVRIKSGVNESNSYRTFDDFSHEFGDDGAIMQMVFDAGYKMATVHKLAHGPYVVDIHGERTSELNVPAAKVWLMSRCAIKEADAEAVLKQATADRHGTHQFYFEPPEALMQKAGYNLSFNRWPNMEPTLNDEFGTLMEPDNQFILRADKNDPVIEPHRIGDRYSAQTAETIQGETPMQLYQQSQESGMPSMFEHGVVGELVHTYDSSAMVDKYLPKLEEALDCLGRILFLFYWKPEDFSTAYGTNDQSQLENKLTSNFKSFGELVFELLQKNKQNQQGTVSLT